MVQFFEAPTAGIYDDMDKVREYWRNDYNDAQQRYTAREARRSYATQQRRNMALSQDNEQFYAQNAGLFDDRTGMLGSIGQQQNVPAAAPTNLPAGAVRPGVTPAAGPAQLLGAPGGDPTAAPTTPAATTPSATTPADTTSSGSGLTQSQRDRLAASARYVEPRQYTREELRRDPALARRIQDAADRGEIVLGSMVGGNVMVYPREGNVPGQIGPLYSGRNAVVFGTEIPFTSGLGVDPRATAGRWGFRPIVPLDTDTDFNELPETFDISQYENTPEAETQAGLQTDGNDAEPDADSDDATRNPDPYFQGINDTGAPLQPTAEMRLAAASIRHSVDRARILAHHGDNAGADTAFAAAVQAQMQYIVQSRQVLFHAAAGGSRQAAEALIADVGGLERNSVRVQPTQEATPRFIVQRNVAAPNEPPNWVSASGVPQDFGSFVNSLLNMADQAGAAGRAEAQQAAQQSMMHYQETLLEVAGRDRVALLNSMTELQKAQLDSDTRLALARGEGRVYTDPGTGYSWLVRPGVGPDGRPAPVVSVLQMQDLPGPNVDGNRNETVPTPTITPVG